MTNDYSGIDLTKYIKKGCDVTIDGWHYECRAVDERAVYVKKDHGGWVQFPLSSVTDVIVDLPDNQGTMSVSSWFIRYHNDIGQLHRIDGPAAIRPATPSQEQAESYWINGDKYTKDQWQMIVFTLHKQAQNND